MATVFTRVAEIAPEGESRSAGLVRSLAIVLASTLLIALCAHVSLPLPWTPVPLTLQDFAVLLIGLAMGPRAAFATLVLYLAEGAVGLPVFNPHGPGGLAQLSGPTGGFLMAYPFAAALASALSRRARSMSSLLLAGFAFNLVLFAMGAGWLGVLTHPRVSALLAAAVLPFLPGALLKTAAAAGVIGAWRKVRSPSE